MAFVVNHAPASIAMSLAAQAGRGDRVMREQQLRSQQMQDQLAQQDAMRRQQAFEISSALDQKRMDQDILRYQDQRVDTLADNTLSRDKFGLDLKQFEYGKTKDQAEQDFLLRKMTEDARRNLEREAYNQKLLDMRNRQGDARIDISQGNLMAKKYLGELGAGIQQQNADTRGRVADQGDRRLGLMEQTQQDNQQYRTQQAQRSQRTRVLASVMRAMQGNGIMSRPLDEAMIDEAQRITDDILAGGEGGVGAAPEPAPAQPVIPVIGFPGQQVPPVQQKGGAPRIAPSTPDKPPPGAKNPVGDENGQLIGWRMPDGKAYDFQGNLIPE